MSASQGSILSAGTFPPRVRPELASSVVQAAFGCPCSCSILYLSLGCVLARQLGIRRSSISRSKSEQGDGEGSGGGDRAGE